MIQKRTVLTVSDNSGIKEVYCYHKNTRRIAQVGDLIWVVTRKNKPGFGVKYKKGTPLMGLVVSTTNRVKRGSNYIFGSDNAVVLFDKGKPIFSRILKEILFETNITGKYNNVMKMATKII